MWVYGIIISPMKSMNEEDLLKMTDCHRTVTRRGYCCIKRAVDIFFSLAAIAFFLPLFVLVGIAIRMDSPGPVFFLQQRAGRKGKPFRMIKFRSMYAGAESMRGDILHLNEISGPVFKIMNDVRITHIGRILRKFSLDELPQLFNIFLGSMSLVGPRPLPVSEMDRCSPEQRQRLLVTPGLTGLWQVSGRNDIRDFNKWVYFDLHYVKHQSFLLDAKIIGRTFSVVISGKGAY